ncbi:leucine-rich repeat-containing protein 15-like [Euwallacea similis]|uniref:leucine-rich repeat-containing protein 15-like n=1 Tax=Euwallacea similis TaxID=1736056 RepID=UPI00344E3E1D
MKILILLVVAASVVLALPPIKRICVPNCNCVDQLPNILNVASCNGPVTINSTLFHNLEKNYVNVVKFSNVTITKIDKNTFKTLPKLEDVIISQARIGSVDENAFDTVKTVLFIDCAFEDNPKLYSEVIEELHFGNCKLDVIPPLDNLLSLKLLNLSGNYIKEISITTFAEVFDLESLDLSNNEISRVSADIFVNNQMLNSLYLDNNPLKMFFLNTSNNLETLSLKNCFLTTFDSRSTQKLLDLNELNLMNNRITNLKAADLAFMTELQLINLANNNLTTLDDDVFSRNHKLERIILDGNKFENLPNFTLANDIFQMYDFSCQNCHLTMVHRNVFKSMPTLVKLNLSHNRLTYVQDMLTYLRSLLMLDLSHNKIQILTNAFDNNKNLETLNVANNPLLQLNPENFAFNHVLNKLDASNCKINKLWSNNATTLNALKKLYLPSNELVTLSVSDFEIIPKLEIIDLSDNPLKFNDKLCKAINHLESMSVNLVDSRKPYYEPLIDDIDTFINNGWDKLRKDYCPEVSNDIEETEIDDEKIDMNYDSHKSFDGVNDEHEQLEQLPADDDDDDYYNYEDDYKSDEYEDGEKPVTAASESAEENNLARVSYILSITSVFVLTALAVLIVVVVITLCFLRRNNGANMYKANLPRIKIIPRLTAQFEKKHSGSIYRPLSEDLSGPATPKMSRYTFTAPPSVHSNP